MEVNDGTNMFFVDKDSIDDGPKEIRFMDNMAKDIVANTWDICVKSDITPSLLPSAYLEAFKMVIPSLLRSIDKSGGDYVKDYIDGQIIALNLVIGILEKHKAKK